MAVIILVFVKSTERYSGRESLHSQCNLNKQSSLWELQRSVHGKYVFTISVVYKGTMPFDRRGLRLHFNELEVWCQKLKSRTTLKTGFAMKNTVSFPYTVQLWFKTQRFALRITTIGHNLVKWLNLDKAGLTFLRSLLKEQCNVSTISRLWVQIKG